MKASKGPYHHGDLRTALLDAGFKLLEERGAEALSVRALARQVGVSYAAPARHFPDRKALLAELAARAFQSFSKTLRTAREQEPDPCMALAAMGKAYVRFALDHPAQMRLMFSPDFEALAPMPESLQQASTDAFEVLDAGVRRLLPASATDLEVETATFAAWAHVHGAAQLWLDGPYRRGQSLRAARAHFLAIADAGIEQQARHIAPAKARRSK